jgi:hypothetical protein
MRELISVRMNMENSLSGNGMRSAIVKIARREGWISALFTRN